MYIFFVSSLDEVSDKCHEEHDHREDGDGQKILVWSSDDDISHDFCHYQGAYAKEDTKACAP